MPCRGIVLPARSGAAMRHQDTRGFLPARARQTCRHRGPGQGGPHPARNRRVGAWAEGSHDILAPPRGHPAQPAATQHGRSRPSCQSRRLRARLPPRLPPLAAHVHHASRFPRPYRIDAWVRESPAGPSVGPRCARTTERGFLERAGMQGGLSGLQTAPRQQGKRPKIPLPGHAPQATRPAWRNGGL